MKANKLPVPTEDIEQTCLFRWVAYMLHRWPELQLMFHIPNGGKRNKIEAARFKEQGVKSGVPDIFLPVAKCGYHGLFIEMKRIQGGTLSHEQKWYIEKLRNQGYLVEVCKGYLAAIDIIESYMKNDSPIR